MVRAFDFFSRKTVTFLKLKIALRESERDKNCNGKRYDTLWYGIGDKIGAPTVRINF